MRKIKLVFILAITFFISASSFKITRVDSQVNGKNVLILMGPGYGLPTIDLFFPPLHEHLLTNGLDRNKIHYEFLGLDRYNTEDAKLSILSYIETKYATVQLDLIVAASSDAAQFIVEFATDFQPSVPLLTSGFYFEPNWISEPRQLIKIQSELKPIETLDLATTLFPDSSSIFIVTGADATSQDIKNDLIGAIGLFHNFSQVEDSTLMTHEEMLNHVSQLDAKTLVFFASYFQDAANQNFVPAFVAKTISSQSTVAVFGLRDVHIYNGRLSAGVATDTSSLGRQTADVIIGYFNGDIILNGEVILIAAEASTILDWSSLKRQGANLSVIPSDAIILFYELTTWQEHGEFITRMIAVFVILLAFSVYTNILLIQNKKVKKRYQTLGAGSLTVTWEVNQYGHFQYASKEAQAVFGKSCKELTKKIKLWDLFDADNLAVIEEHLKGVKISVESSKEIITISTIHDKRIMLKSVINPIFNKKGDNTGYIGTTQDVTEVMRVKEQLEQAEKSYARISKASKTGVWEYYINEKKWWFSDEICNILDFGSNEVGVGDQVWCEQLNPSDQNLVMNKINDYVQNPKSIYEETFRLNASDNSYRWVLLRGNITQDGSMTLSRKVVGTYMDITSRVLVENQRNKEHQDLLTSQKIAKLGTWRLDIKTNEVTWSEELYKMYGFDPTKPVPPYTEHMKLFTKLSWEKLSSALLLTSTQGVPYELELEMASDGISNGWMWVKGEAEYDEQGQIASLTGAAKDITERKTLEESIRLKAYHDELTGLPNRIYFEEQIKSFDIEENYPLLIAIADLDGLKIINDTYGIEVGDDVLKAIANVLSGCNQSCFVARIAGDEFGLVYRQMTPQRFEQIKSKLIRKIEEIKVNDIHVSITFGYDVKHRNKDQLRNVLINAENNMYSNSLLQGQSSRNETIMALFHALTDKYEEERIHSNRVSMYCKLMGEKLNLRQDEVRELEFAGLMHDIGKITIPDAILDKPGKLTSEEWVVMKKHTVNGYQILHSASKYSRLAEYALTHHERWDGKGYPNGLKGEEIPLFSRIICISDAYEAMTADRPYRKALNHEVAVAELHRCAGSQFDESLVEVFINEVLNELIKN